MMKQGLLGLFVSPTLLLFFKNAYLWFFAPPPPPQKQNKGCVTPWPRPLTLKSVLRQKKNYENSNISPCKNILFKKKKIN
jgi:hypothetical protein